MLRIDTILGQIPRQKLTRLWGLCYALGNRTQGVPLSISQNQGYNPDYVAVIIII
ncbi:MAG: ubiquitin conjugating protein [Limnospira sp. PMC 1286.21]|uniref:ubiquitin conjugating protein n=1 Tax=Limnospira TaxID=2596745 RepID=UPI00030FCAD1|nr:MULTISPECIES: ubiquitin conjugating protein [Limnospira]MDT9232303.1 ubiquitin conjugating protein [Limnospira sp. PMC 917.15]MDT9273178.1 ubiquitin conjugating protein [Limnospira sp. PMC 737.11]MDT9324320.1 ubiquitin conjugating protein [Limnospira sp. PMC 1286.21]MDY7052022.1 ubiquitin conjugating protein [Limnospira fusiformis LS22]MDT9319174.1 ubiquitin conjugating protein [Limnospira sp. PMC 1290.21]